GHLPGLAHQRDGAFVLRQAIERRAEPRGEVLEALERAGLLERAGVELERGVRRVHAGTAAGALLVAARMRRAVGAEEELRITRRGGLDQRLAVLFALEH